ncbi:hypothetical protein [Singulisphaera acidiphila]|uniref:Uncharacterized protein n=1 Tax=Singulisphaera acidiphila (strain ATCC BAA-1392 / DSM 18658 / VKM B-2454 / MOB10) TaxID=886293 RepID=L0D5A4_SINAD|nr:hypothetical protein [Singulisphaera acidiphila]AGA24614.1 hypothetical protein Sinac_0157 [Singulisphaera acidiphila DSM 18658]
MSAPDLTPDARRPTKPNTPPSTPAEDLGTVTQGRLQDLIRKQVVRSLGSPADLLAIHVRPLWDDRYRVNVVVGKEYTSSKIIQSYFLAADSDGNIIRSSPEVTRLY